MANQRRLEELLGRIKPASPPSVTVDGSGSVGQLNVISDSSVYFSHPNGRNPVAVRPGAVIASSEEDAHSYGDKNAPHFPGIGEITERAKTLAAMETLLACHEVYLDSVWRRLIETMDLQPGTPLPAEKFAEA